MTPDSDRPSRTRLPACEFCGSRWDRCRCDEPGDALAASLGVDLPSIGDGRIFGGHLGDTNRGDPTDRLRTLAQSQGVELYRTGAHDALEAGPPAGHVLRHHSDIVRDRLAHIERLLSVLPGERRRRSDQARILALMFDGEGLSQAAIAKKIGKDRQWVNRFIADIRAECFARIQAGEILTTRCPCGREFAMTISPHGGRPRRFCNNECRKRFHKKAERGRNRGRNRQGPRRRRVSATRGARR